MRLRLTLSSLSLGAYMAAPISQAAILGQDYLGDVLSINTGNATASLFLDLDDVTGTGVEPNNSPNALGYNGDAFRTPFVSGSGSVNVDLFRNNDSILTLSSEPQYSVAAADVLGDNYYFIDRNGGYSRVTGINGGTPTRTDITTLATGGNTLGDLAITPDGAFMMVSYGANGLAMFNLASGALQASYSGAVRRYAGLAYDGSSLFGIVGGNPGGTGSPTPSELWRLDISGNLVTPVKIGDIKWNGQDVFLTDAAPAPAPVPLPAAAWLLLSGLAGLGLFGRKRIVG
jgi:hypothetical protein